MLGLTMHTLADIADVSEDRALVTVTMNRGGCDSVAFAGRREKRWVLGMQLRVEALEELRVQIVTV